MRKALRYTPHAITLSSLVCGCLAIHLVFERDFGSAGIAILLAAALDSLDGLVARTFALETDEGLQLDSLADLVNFGVAPAFLVFEGYGNALGLLGALSAITYVLAAAVRLARYNVAADKPSTNRIGRPATPTYYKGLPSTGAAILSIIAIMLISLPPLAYFSVEIAVATQLLFAVLMITPWRYPKAATMYRNLQARNRS